MRKLGVLVGVGLLVATAPVGIVVTEGFLHPPRKALSADSRNAATQLAESLGARLEDAQIAAADGVPLRAWFFRAVKCQSQLAPAPSIPGLGARPDRGGGRAVVGA